MIRRILQAAVARARAESTRVRELLGRLEGHGIDVAVQGTPVQLAIRCRDGELRVAAKPGAGATDAEIPDATVRGTPMALLALAAADRQDIVSRGDVQIEGSAHVAQDFRDLARLLRPDLEPLLAGITGRSLAHLLVRGAQGIAEWTRDTAWTQARNLSEYLAHERLDLVPLAESEGFLRGVDEVRDQMERLAARLRHLETHPALSGGGREPA